MKVFLIIYAVIVFISTLIEFSITMGANELITPSFIYANTKLNDFGCWFCFIVLSICSPIIFIGKCVFIAFVYIYDFIVWLFTHGR